MSRPLFVVFLWFLIYVSPVANGQDYPMIHYGIEDGLPSNTVYSIYRDSKGFLWFATDKGIARYNGIKFETFTTFDGLPDNEVFLFKEDYEHRLWLCTYNGELCYYKDGIFHTAENTPFLKMPFKVSHIYNISLETDSSVTFNFFNSRILVNINGEKLSFIDFSKTAYLRHTNNDEYYILYKRKLGENRYKIFQSYGIYIVDTQFNFIEKKDAFYGNRMIYTQVQDKGYFTNGEYFFSYNLDTLFCLKKNVYYKKTIRQYYYDGLNVFISTDKGIIINDSISILNDCSVSSLTQDSYKYYWISTLNNGVYCLSNDFLHTAVFNNLYSGEIKYSTIQNNYLYYVTSDNSFNSFKNGKSVCIFDYNQVKEKYGFPLLDGAYLVNAYRRWYHYINRYYVFSYNWLTKQKHICYYYGISDNLFGVKDAFLIGDYIFVKGRSSVLRIDYNDVIIKDSLKYTYLGQNNAQRIFGMSEDTDSALWYSTLTNMYRYSGSKFIDQLIFKNIAFKFFIFFSHRIVGYTHNNQLLVCGYLKGGIEVDTIVQEKCIWDKMYVIDSNHLLVSTNNFYRVLVANNTNGKIAVQAIENPFLPKNVESICIDSMNCYFFKKRILTVIPKKVILDSSPTPELFFTGLKTTKKNYTTDSSINIPFNESKNISVSFLCLHISGESIKQQYSISKDGLDNWIDFKGDEIRFVNMSYGTYTIKLRVRSLSSDYSQPISFVLTINKPFWVSLWFIAVVIVAATMGIILLIRYRIKYVLIKSEQEHINKVKFLQSEYKALNALMNPHFIFNTLNNVQGLVNKNDKLAANEYLRIFSDMVRQNMHNVSREVISLQKEMDLVVNYLLLEKLRFKDHLNYYINVEDKIDLEEIMIPPLLVQPLVENSIKHGILPLDSINGCIIINVFELDNDVFVQVKDNGIGMAKAKAKSREKLHESYGMGNIMKRIEQLSIIQNKKIGLEISEEYDHSENQNWTIVTINIPFDSI